MTIPGWPPMNPQMPDLSGLNPTLILLPSLGRLLGGGPRDPMTFELIMNFVRLVDKAVTSYEGARQDLEAVSRGSPGIASLMRATSQMETCVVACRRAYGFAIRF